LSFTKQQFMSASNFIQQLNLEPHSEGGYYKENFRSGFEVKNVDNNTRSALTSIYYLLEEGDFSALHRIKSDEIWYFHAGNPLDLVAINEKGNLLEWKLGNDLSQGQVLQVNMLAGWIFGARCSEGFSLVGCAVAPGFHFEDFEIIDRISLLEMYPQHSAVIENFSR
jgi:uncharacterized protein